MNILEKQRFYQKGHGPIYMRTPISRTLTRGAYGLATVGCIYSAYNFYLLIIGKG